jgi:spoIIIJ-associated protein
MQTIEKTGETVESAIAAGLAELGVTAADVMVEVLDEPSSGVMGIGAKPARVRLVLMRQPEMPLPPKPTTSAPSAPTPAPASTPKSVERQPRRPPQPNRQRPPARQQASTPDFDYEEDDIAEPTGDEVADADADETARVGKEILLELLKRMGVQGKIDILRAEPTREGENLHWILNITGRNIGRLIGRKGETLAALQYLVRLVISRRLQTRANIIVDAGMYKANRANRLKQLAQRMADQALSQGRMVILEPMPPHERRIVHLALRSRPDVETKSIGEGDARKVTISPVK